MLPRCTRRKFQRNMRRRNGQGGGGQCVEVYLFTSVFSACFVARHQSWGQRINAVSVRACNPLPVAYICAKIAMAWMFQVLTLLMKVNIYSCQYACHRWKVKRKNILLREQRIWPFARLHWHRYSISLRRERKRERESHICSLSHVTVTFLFAHIPSHPNILQ